MILDPHVRLVRPERTYIQVLRGAGAQLRRAIAPHDGPVRRDVRLVIELGNQIRKSAGVSHISWLVRLCGRVGERGIRGEGSNLW